MNSRRNFWIRTLAGVAGDIGIGVALAGACLWIIESAALGLFLAFLLWIIALLLGLSFSQYVVYPTVSAVLSDSKLNDTINAFSAMASPLWQQLRDGIRRFTEESRAT